MTSLQRFRLSDLLTFNSVNLDPLTETYNIGFYLEYYTRWPEYFTSTVSHDNRVQGYVMGKSEGVDNGTVQSGPNKGSSYGLWHGHVTCLTVQPMYRRLGIARQLMDSLETVSQETYNGWFVDLFVRASNFRAREMYESFGYVPFRRVLGYYSGEEDAWDYRKLLERDKDGFSCIPLEKAIEPEELEW